MIQSSSAELICSRPRLGRVSSLVIGCLDVQSNSELRSFGRLSPDYVPITNASRGRTWTTPARLRRAPHTDCVVHDQTTHLAVEDSRQRAVKNKIVQGIIHQETFSNAWKRPSTNTDMALRVCRLIELGHIRAVEKDNDMRPKYDNKFNLICRDKRAMLADSMGVWTRRSWRCAK